MLLCDGCGRGHHTHCLRPRLKVQVPPSGPEEQLLHTNSSCCLVLTGVVTHLVFCQAVPGGDWFCPDCRPKQRAKRLPCRRQRPPVHEEEEEEDAEEQDKEESAEEEELLDEEVAVRYDRKHFFDFFLQS